MNAQSGVCNRVDLFVVFSSSDAIDWVANVININRLVRLCCESAISGPFLRGAIFYIPCTIYETGRTSSIHSCRGHTVVVTGISSGCIALPLAIQKLD